MLTRYYCILSDGSVATVIAYSAQQARQLATARGYLVIDVQTASTPPRNTVTRHARRIA